MSSNLLKSFCKRSSFKKIQSYYNVGHNFSVWRRTLFIGSILKKNQLGKLLEEPEEDYKEKLDSLHSNEEEDFYDESYGDKEDYDIEPADEKTQNMKVVQSASGTPSRRLKTFTPELEKLRIGTTSVPPELVNKIETVLRGYPRALLRRDATSLSNKLRARTTEPVLSRKRHLKVEETFTTEMKKEAKQLGIGLESKNNTKGSKDDPYTTPIEVKHPTIKYGKTDSLAYLAHRLPGVYACNYRVLNELSTRFPNFLPKKVLDFGSGPGSASWAAREVWPGIQRFSIVEPSDFMSGVNELVLKDFPRLSRSRFIHECPEEQYDLAIASYVLTELEDDQNRRVAVRSIWDRLAIGGVMVIIEPGTPIGFKVVRNARTMILDLNSYTKENLANLLAPCTHTMQCPQPAWSWCHFSQRVQRIKLQQDAKRGTGAVQDWENEKYSYVVFSKGKLDTTHTSAQTRLILQPLKKKGHIYLDGCTSQGQLRRIIVKKSTGKEIYKSARKATWGDLFNFNRFDELEPSTKETNKSE
eukprot:TRINITY_DN1050_c0_g2_i1.p1 TRINITY_DN1050_c0_g2~~TRINITY_DN1050_c0_g2_i1.p1  ORF type:complete len:527 (+),score=83.70 TRINITY_DN1050_c0_g2_i1:113-1693(+)